MQNGFRARPILALALYVSAALLAAACGDDEPTNAGSVCDRLSLSGDQLELRYDGIVVLASGVNGATVTTSTDGGPTTTITATATRTQTAGGRIITSYTATINGVSCTGP